MDDKSRLAEELKRKILSPREGSSYNPYEEEDRFESGVSSILDKVHRQILSQMGITKGKTTSQTESGITKNPKTQGEKIKNIILLDRRVRENMKELVLSLFDFGDAQIIREILTDHIAFLVGILSELEKK
jgi:hypothetical protein